MSIKPLEGEKYWSADCALDGLDPTKFGCVQVKEEKCANQNKFQIATWPVGKIEIRTENSKYLRDFNFSM